MQPCHIECLSLFLKYVCISGGHAWTRLLTPCSPEDFTLQRWNILRASYSHYSYRIKTSLSSILVVQYQHTGISSTIIPALSTFFYTFQLLLLIFVKPSPFTLVLTSFLFRYASRLRADAQGSVHSYTWGYLVVLYFNNHLILHGQLGSLPHCGKNGRTHRFCRRPRQTDQD